MQVWIAQGPKIHATHDMCDEKILWNNPHVVPHSFPRRPKKRELIRYDTCLTFMTIGRLVNTKREWRTITITKKCIANQKNPQKLHRARPAHRRQVLPESRAAGRFQCPRSIRSRLTCLNEQCGYSPRYQNRMTQLSTGVAKLLPQSFAHK